MNPKTDTTDDVLVAIRRIIRAVYLHSRKLHQSYSLTGPQALILKGIQARRRLSPSELAKQLSLSQATITDIVKRLEQRGLVTRVPDSKDRRKIMLEITKEGKVLIKAAPPLLQEQFTKRFNKLQDWEQTLLLSSLQRVASLMDAEDLDAAPMFTSGPPQVTLKEVQDPDNQTKG